VRDALSGAAGDDRDVPWRAAGAGRFELGAGHAGRGVYEQGADGTADVERGESCMAVVFG
jgi:hypothetical protein